GTGPLPRLAGGQSGERTAGQPVRGGRQGTPRAGRRLAVGRQELALAVGKPARCRAADSLRRESDLAVRLTPPGRAFDIPALVPYHARLASQPDTLMIVISS